MEGCLGASNEGSVSPETVRRWIVNVDNVLGTSIGRQKFQDFLHNCSGFEEGVQLIIFWEMCHLLVPDEEFIASKRKKRKWYSSRKTVDDKTVYTKANEIVLYANEYINVDSGHLQRIDSAIKNSDLNDVLNSILEIKKETVLLLEKYHLLFKDNLLKQQGLDH